MTEYVVCGVKLAVGSVVGLIVGLHWMIHLLILAMLFDIATGILAAFYTGTVDSELSRKGMTKKAQTLLMVAGAEILGRFVMLEVGTPWGSSLTVGGAVAGYYCITEAISITENVVRTGVPLPRFVGGALQRLHHQWGKVGDAVAEKVGDEVATRVADKMTEGFSGEEDYHRKDERR